MQIDALRRADVPETQIFIERGSGVRRDRPVFTTLLTLLQPGDTLIVWKLDRLARSTIHLLELMEHFAKCNINFISLQEPWLERTSSVGQLMFTIIAGFAQFEREMIRERTSAGVQYAKELRGRWGRSKKLAEGETQLVLDLYRRDTSVASIADHLEGLGKKVHRATIYRALHEAGAFAAA